MEFSFFSVLMSLIFSSLYIVAIAFLRKRDKFIISFNVLPLMFLIVLTILRVLINVELKYARSVNSYIILPNLVDLLRKPLHLGLDINLAELILFIWIAGASLVFAKSLYSYRGFKKQLKGFSKLSLKEDRVRLEELKASLGLKKNISIYRSEEIKVPIVVGIVENTIYLPKIYIEDKDLDNILLHELNHVVSRDNLKKILILLLKIIFWWNPFIYLFNDNIDHIMEIQCDLRTTLAMEKSSRQDYLASILSIIKATKNKPGRQTVYSNLQVSSLYSSEGEKLKQRFNIVLNYKKNPKVRNRKKAVFYISATAIFILSYVFTLKPVYLPPGDEIYLEYEEGPRIKRDRSFILESKE